MLNVRLLLIVWVSLAYGCGRKNATTPAEEIPDGPDWSYQELFEHLKSRGVPLRMTPFRGGQLYLITTDGDELSAGLAGSRIEKGEKVATAVVCNKTNSGRQAREIAAQTQPRSYAWGRFVFSGSEEALDLFRVALTAPQVVTDPDAALDFQDVQAKLRAKGLPAKLRTVSGSRLVILAETDAETDAIARAFDDERLLKARSIRPDEFAKLKPSTAAAFNSALIIMKHRFHVQALESAGESPLSFATGRFSFFAIQTTEAPHQTNNEALKKIKAALQ